MTNREWIKNMTDEEYEEFNKTIKYRCQVCMFYNSASCAKCHKKLDGQFNKYICTNGMEMWLQAEHKEGNNEQ